MKVVGTDFFVLQSFSALSGACHSDVPAPAVMEAPRFSLRVTVTRVATPSVLTRYNLKVRIERADGRVAASELFPDDGAGSEPRGFGC